MSARKVRNRFVASFCARAQLLVAKALAWPLWPRHGASATFLLRFDKVLVKEIRTSIRYVYLPV